MDKIKTHELKTWPEYFEDVYYGRKNFELRKNDRGFKVGDWLLLQEYSPTTELYSGRWCKLKIKYILYGGAFGLESSCCVLGLEDLYSSGVKGRSDDQNLQR